MNRELVILKRERAKNDAADIYFNDRPQLERTIERERIFEAGFRMAWESNKGGLDPTPVAWQNMNRPSEFYEHDNLGEFWRGEFRPLYAEHPDQSTRIAELEKQLKIKPNEIITTGPV